MSLAETAADDDGDGAKIDMTGAYEAINNAEQYGQMSYRLLEEEEGGGGGGTKIEAFYMKK